MILRPAGASTVALTAMGECARCRTSMAVATLVADEFWGSCCARCLAVLEQG